MTTEQLTYRVKDMTCGHCVAAITQAVQQADPAATVNIDLPQHLVKVATGTDANVIRKAIREAGYTPEMA
ncbi:heavy-metal-associated domain-containing protein [Lacisediminimonas sp.]|uniref:heavy-metal-associated domain-containing protein n=1 Tax=Lacisediminimonas sp. TaxID=3060582 RepID=UPI00271D1B6D|nr:heavy-metal-associated domain-containing protein [Lacisediminimonas sp.]MDO8300765.1 heavy-metal-associated domain-containing protein [Lacisediminimonas sp.]MDO9218041.1 heavy-metal-associated domain-containing protein [Lacisediminimonas sp.]